MKSSRPRFHLRAVTALVLSGVLIGACVLPSCAASAASASMPGTAAPPAPAASASTRCPADDALRAPDLYGQWSVDLPALGARGRLTLKQHPEFSDSLRGLFDYAGPNANGGDPIGHVQSIASGDIEAGDFNLDESRDGKSFYAFWTGHVQPAEAARDK